MKEIGCFATRCTEKMIQPRKHNTPYHRPFARPAIPLARHTGYKSSAHGAPVPARFEWRGRGTVFRACEGGGDERGEGEGIVLGKGISYGM
jgi:hypothetical protein